MLDLIGEQRLAEVTAYLADELSRLARAGADFGLFASNTPHLVFDELQRQSPIPLISIVEAACAAARAAGLKRVGLLGTRFTMQARFYPDVFGREGIAVVVPSLDDQDYVHERYMGELVPGVFRDETRAGLLAVVERMRQRDGVEGVILGGTELSLLLREPSAGGIPLLDTMRIHVERALAELL
jgi:aspartate racemase